jgi:phosphatidate cytidylyltransferase/phytol kinase
MRFFPVLGTALALLGLFAVSEFAGRRGLSSETTRRMVHIAGAGTTALFPLYLHLSEVVALGVVFTLFLIWTRVRGSLKSVHAVARPTVGAILFPVGLVVAAVIAWSHPPAFSYAALMLALPDPAAAVIGRRLASLHWRVLGGEKSLLGSLAFFVVAFVIGMGFVLATGNGSILTVATVALVITGVEAALGYGLDNLFIPVLSGLLGEYWIML